MDLKISEIVLTCFFLFVKMLFYFQSVDAVDNGVNQYDLDESPKYVINTGLGSRIKRFNLDWTDSDQSSDAENEAFHRAMALAGGEFLEVRLFWSVHV